MKKIVSSEKLIFKGVVRYIPNLKKWLIFAIWQVLFVSFSFCVLSDNFYEKSSVVCNSLGGTVYKEDFASVVLNPACVNYSQRSGLAASYTYLDENVRFNSLVYVDNYEKINFSILFSQIYQDNIFVRQSILDEGIPTYMNKIFGLLSVGGEIYSFKIGGSVKAVYYDIYQTKSNIPFGVDLGISRNILSIGSYLKNKLLIYGGVGFINVLPLNVKIGTDKENYTFYPSVFLNSELSLFPKYNLKKETLTYDTLSLFFNFNNFLRCGLEYRKDKFFVRVGYNPESFSKVSFGLAAKFENIELNYAFVPFVGFGIHSLGFSYLWGETRESEEKTPAELEDFLQIQKKALRIAEKYSRDAEELIKDKKYESALELLYKVYPLAKEYTKIFDLINVCKNAIDVSLTNSVSTEYNKDIISSDYISAYDEVLKAVENIPQQQFTKQLVEEFNKKNVPLSQFKFVDNKKSAFVLKVKNNIKQYVEEYNFNKAKTELKKLELISYDDFVEQKEFIENAIKEYANNLVDKAMQYYKNKQYDYSYFCLSEAYNVLKDDSIKIQIEQVKQKFSKPNLYNELYYKKLFYLACCHFAVDEYQNAKQLFFELRKKYPLFDYELLLESLKNKKVITQQELIP